MDLTRTEIAFRNFARNVEKRTKQRISQRGNKASGNLNKSISFRTIVKQNSIQLVYNRPAYADFQDQGVSGTEKKYNTPFSYTTKKPPAKVFEGWAKSKGIAPRKANGQFMTFKSFGFAIANKILKEGIKPKKFFTDTFVKEFNNLAIPIQKAYAEDAMDLLKTAIK